MKHVLIALCLLAACATGATGEDSDEPAPTARIIDPGGCPDWGCGANSATVGDGLIFDELDSSMVTPNRGGLKIAGAKLVDGTPVTMRVWRDILYAVGRDGAIYFDSQLIGTIIILKHPVYGAYEAQIAVVKTQALTFWAGAHDPVRFYEIRTRKLGETKFAQYACRSELTSDPTWSTDPHLAIVFQGDRYDATYKKVTETSPSDPWFNIACAATAPAKMHLMRHTRAGSYDASGAIAYDTSIPQRTALLKMYTADYCGTGHVFTVDGTPLSYQDRNHWVPMPPYIAKESVWTETGAACLDTPRYVDLGTIYSVCGFVPPSCGTISWPWESVGYAFSAIPPP